MFFNRTSALIDWLKTNLVLRLAIIIFAGITFTSVTFADVTFTDVTTASTAYPKSLSNTENKPNRPATTPGLANQYLVSLEANIKKFPNTTSILVRRNGELVYEQYFGKGTKGTRDLLNDTRSSTKSLTALAIGLLLEKDGFSLSAPAFQYLQSHAPFKNDSALKQQITVQDLLTMTSALDCDDNRKTPGNEENMYPQKYWVEWATNIPTVDNYKRNPNGLGRFSYCTAASMLLGQIISNVSGKSLDVFFSEKLFAPLGIKKWQWARSPSGEFMSGGGLRLRARDLSKIGQMLLNQGSWNGRQVIPKAWSKEVLKPRLRANEKQEYGYQFWRRNWTSQCGTVAASYMAGNGGNAIIVMPTINTVISVTRTHYGRREMHQQTIEIVENYLLNALLCQPKLAQ